MKYLCTPLLTLSALLCLGCNTENPICTDNYCITGEVFARSEIGDREFDEVDIDDSELIQAYQDLITPEPTPTTPTIHVSDIQADVEMHGQQSDYIGEWVSVSGIVDWKSKDMLSLTISASGNFLNDDATVFFIVNYSADPLKFKTLSVGETQTFPVYVRQVEKSKVNGKTFSIFSLHL